MGVKEQKMTRGEAIKLLVNATYSDEWQGNEDLTAAHNMAIEALEMVEEFEKAQIITGGRLNGRTYAYKCGLEDGKRKALEQETSKDAVSRKAMLDAITEIDENINIDIYTNEVREIIRELPPVTPTRKKGKWIEEPNRWLRCSCCNSHHPHTSIYAIRGSNYCPKCGAEMESEE